MGKSEKQNRTPERKGSQTKVERNDLEDDVDAVFRLSLAEFTGARNVLAAQLKKSGRGDDAAAVKALAKPSVTAWAVNQLYWNHREAFERLIASGERFHQTQTSAAKIADMREALNARREALTELSALAASLLGDAGHSPSPDTIHRITTTLEAMSVFASRSDAPRPGRLTQDVDPPGFDSLASWIPSAGSATPKKEPPRLAPSPPPPPKSGSAAISTRQKVAPDDVARKREELRKAKIAAAKVSLQEAKRSLNETRAQAQSLETAQKKSDAEVKKAGRLKRDAEEQLEKAESALEAAAQRARNIAIEIEKAAGAVDDAERTVIKASQELESSVRESQQNPIL